MPRFSANLGFLWPDRPLLDRVEAAGRAGFEAVEFHWPFDVPAESLRESCRAAGVACLGLNTPVGDAAQGEFGLAALPGREDDFAAAFATSVAYARKVGAGSIHVMAGVVPEEARERAAGTLAANLGRAARLAPDLTLLLEPINHRDKPGYFYDTVEEAVAILDRVGAPNVRILFDVYHVAVAQGDVLTRMRRHREHIGHVQIAAVPSRAEPDEGEIAYPAILAALDEIGYRGWTGLEYRPRAGTDAGLAWMARLGVPLRSG